MVLSDTPVTPALQETEVRRSEMQGIFIYISSSRLELHAKREGREVGEGEEKWGEGGRRGKGERRSKNVGDYF